MGQKTKIALLDFDDVLFNTSDFSSETRRVFLNAGIEEKKYDAFLQTIKEKFQAQNKTYHQKDHIELFALEFPEADHSMIKENLESLNKGMKRFVYEDTRDFLATLSQNGWHCVILTFGNNEWQKTKVYSSGVGDLVEAVEVSKEPSKVETAREILKNNHSAKVIFVDDNPCQALNFVKSKFPYVRTFQFIRPELEHIRVRHNGCDHDCRTFDEIKEKLLFI